MYLDIHIVIPDPDQMQVLGATCMVIPFRTFRTMSIPFANSFALHFLIWIECPGSDLTVEKLILDMRIRVTVGSNFLLHHYDFCSF